VEQGFRPPSCSFGGPIESKGALFASRRFPARTCAGRFAFSITCCWRQSCGARFLPPVHHALGRVVERRNSGIPQQEGLKMSDWRIRHKDADGHDAEATLLCREAAIVQALYLERRQHCRIQMLEGPDGELIDRETFEREHLKRLRW
jgi:hypothetical protein